MPIGARAGWPRDSRQDAAAMGRELQQQNARMDSGQASVLRDVLPPTPPGPEGSNGNGLLRVQWVPGAWLFVHVGPDLG